MYLQGSWQNDSVIQLNEETFIKFKEVNLPESFEAKLEPEILNIFKGQIQNQKLSSIHYFCGQLLENLNEIQNLKYTIGEDFIIQDFQIELKNQYVGCEEFCPFCRKQCDQVHTEDIPSRKHKCKQGHHIISFGGNKQHQTNQAILIGCDEFNNEDEVFFKGENVKWVKFKAEQKNWKFKSDKGKMSRVREQNNKIWNLIGEKICKYYTEIEGVEIKFQPTTNKNPLQLQKNHYILLLDASGSMAGGLWKNLMEAVKTFLNTLTQNPLNINYSKISVIVYSDSSKILIEKETPRVQLVNEIKFQGGGTRFDLPLNDAYTLMQTSYFEFDKFTLCLMTDGDAEYPEITINKFKQSSDLMSKLKFSAIYFGSSSVPSNLTKIANDLNGAVKGVVEADQLAIAFNQLVPNFYKK